MTRVLLELSYFDSYCRNFNSKCSKIILDLFDVCWPYLVVRFFNLTPNLIPLFPSFGTVPYLIILTIRCAH